MGGRAHVRDLLGIAIVALVYVVGAKAGLHLAYANKNVTAVWPPTGISVAALLLLGMRVWPGIAIGALTANLANGAGLTTSLLIMIGNTAAPVVACVLVKRVAHVRTDLARIGDVVGLLLLGGPLSMTLSATLGTASLVLTGALRSGAYWSTWPTWWIGDSMGVVIVAPLILSLASARRGPTRLRGWHLVEFVLVVSGIAATAALTFNTRIPVEFLVFPWVAWAAVRFMRLGASVAVAVVSIVSIVATVNGAGPFVRGLSTTGSLSALQVFNGSLALTALLLAAATAQRKLVGEQLTSVAHTLQTALLPGQLPSLDAVRLASRYRPGATGTEVGGDWFDATLHRNCLTLAIGDVAGRGIEAGAVMGAVRHAMAACAMSEESPASVLTLANEYLRALGPAMVTCFVAQFDLTTGAALAANAGHLPMVIIPPNASPELIDVPSGLPLGIVGNYVYNDCGIEVPAGSALVLYTDGLIERRTRSIDAGLDRLLHTLLLATPTTPEELCDHLLHVFGDGIDDDVALLVAKLSPTIGFSATDALTFRASLRPDIDQLSILRSRLDRWLSEQSVSSWTSFALITAINEAVTNSIIHARGPTPIAVEVSTRAGTVSATVSDQGTWRPNSEPRGRGMDIMRILMDRVSVRTDKDGTTVDLASGPHR